MEWKMDNKRLEEKLDKIVEHISEINTTLAVNTSSLETHIRRTELAESQIQNLQDDIKPIKSHVAFMKGVAWALGVAGSILIGLNELGILKKLF